MIFDWTSGHNMQEVDTDIGLISSSQMTTFLIDHHLFVGPFPIILILSCFNYLNFLIDIFLSARLPGIPMNHALVLPKPPLKQALQPGWLLPS